MAKVLLVEDDNNLREIYQARLSAEGYDITAAQNGEEALSVAKQVHPDLIISDVMMPRISGFEMLDILRNTEELKNTKVIMLTALGQAEDRGRADNLGADKYLVKSQVTLEDIVQAAKDLLGESTQQPEAPTPVAVEPVVESPVPSPVTVTEETPAETTTAVESVSPEAVPTVATPSSPQPLPVTATPETPAEDETTVSVADPDPITLPTAEPAAPAVTMPDEETTSVAPEAVDYSAQPQTTDTPEQPIVTPTPETELTSTTDNPVAASPEMPTAQSMPKPEMPPLESLEQPDVTEASVTTDTTASVQSTADEEALIASQIDSFVGSSSPVDDEPDATPDQPSATASINTEAPSVTSNQPEMPTENDAILEEAIQKLTTPTSTTEAPSQESAPTVPTTAPVAEAAAPAQIPAASPSVSESTTSNDTASPSKRIIQPISQDNTPKPTLEDLLAREDAKESAAAAEPATPPETANAAPAAVAAPKPTIDPNSIAL